MKRKSIILWIICLVLVDQGTKLIVANFFIDTSFYIIKPIFGFRPIFNTQFSYFNSLLKLNLGLLYHTIVLILIQLFILFVIDYYKTRQRSNNTLLDISYIFGQSALICVFCGFYLWGAGILDFIDLFFWTVDLKDIYLNCFVIFFIINEFKYLKERKNSNIKMKNYLSNHWAKFKQGYKNMKSKID